MKPQKRRNAAKNKAKTSQGPAFALVQGSSFGESRLEEGGLGRELTARQLMLAMADLQGLANPDPILRAEGRSISVYRSMVDGHLSAVLGKRLAAVTARPWSIERGKASARATAKLQETFERLDIRGIMDATLEARGLGYSVQEVVWGIDDWLVPERIIKRPQEWFRFGLRGETRFLDDTGGNTIVPPRKLLVARHRDDYLNPYGKPIMAECFWPLAFKRGGLKFWMLFCEKFGLPKTIGKVPASMPEAEKLDLLMRLETMVRAAAAVIPDNSSVELLETKTAGDLPHPALIKWADSEMSKAWLGEVLSTETQGTGTYGAAKAANEVRADLALDDASLVEAQFNQLISWIWEINGLPGPMPWFQIHMPEDLKSARLARDLGLYRMGVRFRQSYFEDVYDISPEHIERIDFGAAPSSTTAASATDTSTAFGEPAEPERSEEVLQALLAELPTGALAKQGKELCKPIMNMAARSSGYAEFLAMMDKEFAEMDSAQADSVLERFCVLSELAGATDSARNAQATLDANA